MDISELSVLLAIIVMDYISGLLAAIYEKKINSAIGRKGIFKKIGIILCVMFCILLEQSNIPGAEAITPIIIIFFIISEGISIIENLKRINVPMPEQLTKLFLKENEKKKISVDKMITLSSMKVNIIK